jgi:hypothetical protein
MPVLTHFDPDDMRFECHVTCSDLTSKAELARALDDYGTALGMIGARMGEKGTYNFAIRMSGKTPLLARLTAKAPRGAALDSVRHIAEAKGNAGDDESWTYLCPEFWLSACQHPELRPKIDGLIDRIEGLLKEANARLPNATASLWEHEETQFGEPLVTLLALHDRSFIPAYVRLLRQWDMDHEVHQAECIDLIVRTHGICAETENLLHCRAAVNPGQGGRDQIENLFPFLQEAYGDVTQSALFERIVTTVHGQDLAERRKAFEDYRSRKAANPATRPPGLPERSLFKYCNYPELTAGAERLFARLDALHPPPDFTSV